MIDWQRFRIAYVQPRRKQLLVSQRVDQGRLIDDLAAGRVDQHSTRLHTGQQFCVNQMSRLTVQRYVYANKVAAFKQFIQLDMLSAQLLIHLGLGRA